MRGWRWLEEEFPVLVRVLRPLGLELNRWLGIEASFWLWAFALLLCTIGALATVKAVCLRYERRPAEGWESFRRRQEIRHAIAKTANGLLIGLAIIAAIFLAISYIS